MRVTAETKNATRERILEVAKRLFAGQGFDAATTRDIAREAQVASGTLFNYFPTKESIALCLISDVWQQALQSFERRSNDSNETSPTTADDAEPSATLEETVCACRCDPPQIKAVSQISFGSIKDFLVAAGGWSGQRQSAASHLAPGSGRASCQRTMAWTMPCHRWRCTCIGPYLPACWNSGPTIAHRGKKILLPCSMSRWICLSIHCLARGTSRHTSFRKPKVKKSEGNTMASIAELVAAFLNPPRQSRLSLSVLCRRCSRLGHCGRCPWAGFDGCGCWARCKRKSPPLTCSIGCGGGFKRPTRRSGNWQRRIGEQQCAFWIR